jgi:hypothetical protein
VVEQAQILVARKDFPAADLREFVAYCQRSFNNPHLWSLKSPHLHHRRATEVTAPKATKGHAPVECPLGNMGAFLVVEAVAQSDGSESISAYRGLAQRSPVLALSMRLFLLSLGGIPFVAGFWAKLYVFWAAAQQGL